MADVLSRGGRSGGRVGVGIDRCGPNHPGVGDVRGSRGRHSDGSRGGGGFQGGRFGGGYYNWGRAVRGEVSRLVIDREVDWFEEA